MKHKSSKINQIKSPPTPPHPTTGSKSFPLADHHQSTEFNKNQQENKQNQSHPTAQGVGQQEKQTNTANPIKTS